MESSIFDSKYRQIFWGFILTSVNPFFLRQIISRPLCFFNLHVTNHFTPGNDHHVLDDAQFFACQIQNYFNVIF